MMKMLIEDKTQTILQEELVLDFINNDISFSFNDKFVEKDVFYNSKVQEEYIVIRIFDYSGELNLENLATKIINYINTNVDFLNLKLYWNDELRKVKEITNCKYTLNIDNNLSEQKKLQEILSLKVNIIGLDSLI